MEQRLQTKAPRMRSLAAFRRTTFYLKGFTAMITSPTSSKSFAAILIAATVALGALTACNTIEGAGQDIQSTGGAIEDAADDNK